MPNLLMKESVSINVKTKQVVRAQGLLHENHVRMYLMIHRSRHCIKTAFDISVFTPPWPGCRPAGHGPKGWRKEHHETEARSVFG